MAVDEARRTPGGDDRIEPAVRQHAVQRLLAERYERKPGRQIERKLVAPPRIGEPGLDPIDVLGGDAVLVLEIAAEPHHRRHLIFRHADALAAQVGGSCDAAIGADVDGRVAEHARQEDRDRHVGRGAARQRDQVGAEADLGDIELAMEVGALEALLHRDGQVVDVAPFNAHAPVGQRAHAVVVPGRDGDRQPAHDRSSVRALTWGGCRWPWLRASTRRSRRR
jgi:hypothetical protein